VSEPTIFTVACQRCGFIAEARLSRTTEASGDLVDFAHICERSDEVRPFTLKCPDLQKAVRDARATRLRERWYLLKGAA